MRDEGEEKEGETDGGKEGEAIREGVDAEADKTEEGDEGEEEGEDDECLVLGVWCLVQSVERRAQSAGGGLRSAECVVEGAEDGGEELVDPEGKGEKGDCADEGEARQIGIAQEALRSEVEREDEVAEVDRERGDGVHESVPEGNGECRVHRSADFLRDAGFDCNSQREKNDDRVGPPRLAAAKDQEVEQDREDREDHDGGLCGGTEEKEEGA